MINKHLFNVANRFRVVRRHYASIKNKHRVNKQYIDALPVFDYGHSKSDYNRVFVWGAVATGALGIPYKNKELFTVQNIRSPKRSFLGERYLVTNACCGLGFSAFVMNVEGKTKVYGTGLNTDSQIGYHEVMKDKPLEILYFPQEIYLPIEDEEQLKVKKLSAGRAHLAVLTNEGLFLMGNNSYGQCGRQIIADEKYMGSKFVNRIKAIDGKSIEDVECGQDHTLAITADGRVYGCGWGADGQTGLGHFNSVSQFTPLEGDIKSEKVVKMSCRCDFVLALNDKGNVFGWGNSEYGQIALDEKLQQVNTPLYLNKCKSLGEIKDIASAGSSCLVVNKKGEVYVWGYGLLGLGEVKYSVEPTLIPSTLFGRNEFQPDTVVEKLATGISHFGAITNKGDLFMWGRNKQGCLGLGHFKDQPFPLRVCMGGIVKQVYCGVDHTITICKPFI